MARKPRLFVSGGRFHVYSRVARGEFVFDDPYEAEEFVEIARKVGDLHDLRILASPLRSPVLIRGRVELTVLATTRFGFRSRDIGTLINKHPSSLTRWITEGTQLIRNDRAFRKRINILEEQIPSSVLNNEAMQSVAPIQNSTWHLATV